MGATALCDKPTVVFNKTGIRNHYGLQPTSPAAVTVVCLSYLLTILMRRVWRVCLTNLTSRTSSTSEQTPTRPHTACLYSPSQSPASFGFWPDVVSECLWWFLFSLRMQGRYACLSISSTSMRILFDHTLYINIVNPPKIFVYNKKELQHKVFWYNSYTFNKAIRWSVKSAILIYCKTGADAQNLKGWSWGKFNR